MESVGQRKLAAHISLSLKGGGAWGAGFLSPVLGATHLPPRAVLLLQLIL